MAGDKLKAWYGKGALYIVLSGLIMVLLLFGLWHIAIPNSLIEGWIKDSLQRWDVIIEIEDLKKGLFYSLRIEQLSLKSQDSLLLTLSNIKVKPDYPFFLRLRPAILINATLAGGALKGNFSITDGLLNLTINGADIRDLGLLRDIGIDGRGSVFGALSINLKESMGNIRFSIADAALNDINNKVYIPLSLFSLVRGVIEINNSGIINIHPLFLEGKGIYGRLQGSGIRSGNFRFSEGSRLEVMVNSDFLLPQFIELSLIRYKRSPGYYVIPLDLESFRVM